MEKEQELAGVDEQTMMQLESAALRMLENDPVFPVVISAIAQQTLSQISSSAYDESQLRETLYLKLKALEEIDMTLRNMASSAKSRL